MLLRISQKTPFLRVFVENSITHTLRIILYYARVNYYRYKCVLVRSFDSWDTFTVVVESHLYLDKLKFKY